ncbi:MAG: flavin reductase family protein [Synergistaceae bacterium]|nr:flavin reductase family protein [Synergistaceae bacterium]
MRKDLGVLQAVWPMPVLMVAAYGEDGRVSVMNAAWGQICAMDKVALFIDEDHKTTKDIRAKKAFTVALADVPHMAEADFFGIATGNTMPDKFERTGLHQTKSAHVDAPIIEELPLSMECELLEIVDTEALHCVVGKIVNVSVDERALDDQGKVDPTKLDAFAFDQFQHGYYAMGKKIGQAWDAGKGLMRQ